ncbi:MAG: hypothetical protein R2749_00475 [Acidimicrobiales bacterium]
MAIMRLGYVHARVTDLEASRSHYSDTLGMEVKAEGDGKLYLKGWDEYDHHSVVLEEGGVGAVKFGFKVSHAADLEQYERALQQFGVTVERMSKGDNLATGDGVRFISPTNHVFELTTRWSTPARRPASSTRRRSPATCAAWAYPASTTR